MPETPRYRQTFFRLLGFLRPYKVSLAISTVFAIGYQASQIALVWLTKNVIDDALAPHDSRKLWFYVGGIVVLGLVRALLMYGRRMISGRQALAVEMDLRQGLYSHLVRLSLGYGLIFFFQNILTVVFVTGVLLIFQWKLALIALAITPVLVVLAYRYSHLAHPTLREVQQKLADVATVAEENIVGVHVVKSFAQEPQESAKFHARSEDVFQQTLRANRQRALYVPFISWIPLLAQGAVLLVGARMVTSGELSVGGFVAFNLYLGMLVTPLRSLGMWIGQAQRATASGERIFQVMDEPEEIAEREDAVELPPGGGDLRFEHVRFEYLEGRPVLDDVTLDVPAGRTIALIGQTGSGKTTLTSLVPRFYDVTSGRVLVDEADVRDVTLSSLRRAIGVISQDPFLFSASVRENITFGAPGLDATEVERIAKLA